MTNSVNTFTLWLSGDPKGKDRPKFNMVTGNVFTPKATSMAETDIRHAWADAQEPRMPDDTPLGIDVTLFYSRPEGHFKKDGTLSAEGMRHERPLKKKPDVDNAIKLVMDSLNSRAYRDDVRICEARVEKHWGEWPATKIRVYALG